MPPSFEGEPEPVALTAPPSPAGARFSTNWDSWITKSPPADAASSAPPSPVTATLRVKSERTTEATSGTAIAPPLPEASLPSNRVSTTSTVEALATRTPPPSPTPRPFRTVTSVMERLASVGESMTSSRLVPAASRAKPWPSTVRSRAPV